MSAAGQSGGDDDAGPILVLGCGLVGASAAGGWSAVGHRVWGHDRRDLGPLLERGWIGRAVPTAELPAALAEAAVVVLALPVSAIVGALRRLPFRAGQLVTDVGSVKGVVMEAAAALPAGTDFVGGHPMAGSEESGYEAARPELFAGAAWALVGEGEPAARVARLVRALGAAPVACDATAHDRVVALTSHLPQLLATALAAELETVAAAGEPLAAALLGPGGRDFLRLAGGSFAVWGDILEHNRAEVERALEGVRGRATLPAAALEEEFAAARRFAARLADRRPVIARSGATKQSRR